MPAPRSTPDRRRNPPKQLPRQRRRYQNISLTRKHNNLRSAASTRPLLLLLLLLLLQACQLRQLVGGIKDQNGIQLGQIGREPHPAQRHVVDRLQIVVHGFYLRLSRGVRPVRGAEAPQQRVAQGGRDRHVARDVAPQLEHARAERAGRGVGARPRDAEDLHVVWYCHWGPPVEGEEMLERKALRDHAAHGDAQDVDGPFDADVTGTQQGSEVRCHRGRRVDFVRHNGPRRAPDSAIVVCEDPVARCCEGRDLGGP